VEDLNDALQEKSEDAATVTLEAWVDTLSLLNDSIQLSSKAAEAYYNLFAAGKVRSISLVRVTAALLA